MPLTEKRVAVYMLSVLVANNSEIHHKTYIQWDHSCADNVVL